MALDGLLPGILGLWKQRALATRISDLSGADAGEGRERVFFGSCGADDFEDPDTANDERVGNQRTMAAPRDCFGAHQRSGPQFRKLNSVLERFLEFHGLHVVREAPKTGVAPAEIDRVALRMAQAAKVLDVAVTDACGGERFREGVGVELGIVAGFRDGADVEQLPDPVRAQQFDEFVNRARGVADGEDGQELPGGWHP